MGIRDFSNVYCAVCCRDTLHLAMKCRDCGTVALTNYEAFRAAQRRVYANGGRHVVRNAVRTHARALRRSRRGIPLSHLEQAK